MTTTARQLEFNDELIVDSHRFLDHFVGRPVALRSNGIIAQYSLAVTKYKLEFIDQALFMVHETSNVSLPCVVVDYGN